MILQKILNRHKQLRTTMQILLLILLAAILLWVLSTMNIIQGGWAAVLNAVFTGLSTIFTLLQWHTQALTESSCATTLLTLDKVVPHEQFVPSIASKRKGGILVYANRKWRGTTLHLLPGLEGTTGSIEGVSNIVERYIGGKRHFLGHFPAIPPGHYTLVASSKQRQVQFTVCSGHLSEIDWR